ncbi:tumor necrosis factor receptor superfamily member 14 isoform X2 [Xenopus laevis]|nr:tumor necrosis factor receptor superfamily member 14 isoform X2 [Xenopus laevis]
MNVITHGLFWLYMGSVFGRILVRGLICNPGEYEIKGECCPMCAPGKVVSKDCTISGNTVCVPCVGGTYMDHINAVSKCLRCRVCDSGSGLTVEQECTYQSNTKCKCKEGYFCNTKDCDLCQPFKECQPGRRVKEHGTLYSDTVCEPCQEGTFSNEIMSSTCHKWTECSEVGLKEDQRGTSTSDSVCSSNMKPREKITLAAPFCFFILSLLIFVMCKKAGKKKNQAHMETD